MRTVFLSAVAVLLLAMATLAAAQGTSEITGRVVDPHAGVRTDG